MPVLLTNQVSEIIFMVWSKLRARLPFKNKTMLVFPAHIGLTWHTDSMFHLNQTPPVYGIDHLHLQPKAEQKTKGKLQVARLKWCLIPMYIQGPTSWSLLQDLDLCNSFICENGSVSRGENDRGGSRGVQLCSLTPL